MATGTHYNKWVKRPRLRQWAYDRARPRLARWLLVLLVIAAPIWSPDLRTTRLALADRAAEIVDGRAFSIAGWEVATLGGRVADTLPGRRPSVTARDTGLVRDYFDAVDQANGLAREENELLAARPPGWETRLATVRGDLAAARADREHGAAPARAVLEMQFDEALRALNLRRSLVQVGLRPGFPPIAVSLTPPLAFTFTQLPLALSVGPRDRIAVTYSALIDPSLDVSTQEGLEDQLDRELGVKSIITPIGGFAAYPSLVPASGGLQSSLDTIGHEWIHHYLEFRPLGWNYFADYEMRTINETVADLASREVAEWVRRTYYPAPSAPSPSPPSAAPPIREDFGSAMRRIRAETEALLATGDLAAVDRYLEEQRRALAAGGYYLRKLNTTYLAFFGAYSAGGNTWEPGLRRLRDRSDSLATFLATIARAGTPEEAQRLILSGPMADATR